MLVISRRRGESVFLSGPGEENYPHALQIIDLTKTHMKYSINGLTQTLPVGSEAMLLGNRVRMRAIKFNGYGQIMLGFDAPKDIAIVRDDAKKKVKA